VPLLSLPRGLREITSIEEYHFRSTTTFDCNQEYFFP